MDVVLDLVLGLSSWSRTHLYQIALAILTSLLIIFGSVIHHSIQRSMGWLHFIIRTSIFILLCAVGYGLFLNWAATWLTRVLSLCNDYSLAPVLLCIFFVLGFLADRR